MLAILLNILLLYNGNDQLKNSVEEYLKNNLSGYSSFEFQIINQPDNYKSISIDESGLFTLNGNLATVPVKVLYADNSSQKNHLILRMRLFKEVFIASRQIKRNESITLSDIKIEIKDITQLRGTAVQTISELNDYIVKTNIQQGSVLVYEHLTTAPVIKAGDKITAQSRSGNVLITVEAFARQDGAEGETIKIQTKDKKQFRAQVLDSQNVLIIE